jgi:RNA polymerase sigma-70 factor (ECF subfamily)
MLQDARQETLARVLEAVRDGGIAQPERLGAFVCATANHVVWEYRRAADRYQLEGDQTPEPIDERMEIERDLISAERKQMVQRVLSGLSSKDREVLRLLFLDECDKHEVCRRLGVTPEYLRVVVHRAKGRFRAKLGRKRREAANV